jgi:GT2 family glycosyltransferase
MKIHLAFLTYNRLDYTKLALAALLADPAEEFSLTIWDNGSSDGTQDYLKTVRDRRIVKMVFSEKNLGQTYVTNKIWSETDAELVGKVDNDCLVTTGWTRILAKAHQDLPQLGVVGCWHFFPGDFDYERAKHKIQTFGNHRIFRHPWVDGSALLVKRKVYQQYGPCREKEYLTRFWLRLALAGYVNGFYYPLVYQEHMDDIRSKHNRLQKMSFEEAYKYIPAFQSGHIKDLQTYHQLHKEILDNLLEGPFNPKFYCGWRARCRRLLEKAKDIPKKLAAAGAY